MKHNKILKTSIISIFVTLYLLVATISMINSVDFFNLSHSIKLSWSLAIGFELGAAASLAGIIILEKTNRNMVIALFVVLTLFQMMANSYHAYANLAEFSDWIELFGLQREDLITQKRILAVISGAVLPLVALGFIKSLTDYIKPSQENVTSEIQEDVSQEDKEKEEDENNKETDSLNKEKNKEETINTTSNKTGNKNLNKKHRKSSFQYD